MEHSKKAYELFMAGYNCSQSVFAAFCDVTGVDEDTALRLSSSFGGGIGRLREVCGALSGMLMAAGILYGYSVPGDYDVKSRHYALVQELASRFRQKTGSIICRELLGLEGASDPVSPVRDAEFFRTRPCPRIIPIAAEILDEYIKEHEPRGKD